MEEKGRPWLSKLGVATETTGVVSEWVDWEAPRRWALFCRRKGSVTRRQEGGLRSPGPPRQGPAGAPAPRGPGGTAGHSGARRHTRALVHPQRGCEPGRGRAHVHGGRHAGPGPSESRLPEHAGMCAGARGPGRVCLRAHTCVGLSAPSAAESLVYSSSALGPKLPPCWPPKPACLFQPLWPPVRELGREEPPPHAWLRASTRV